MFRATARTVLICGILAFALLRPATAGAYASQGGPWERSFSSLCQSQIVLRNSFVYLGTDDGVLHVVRQSDGRTKWTYRAGRAGIAAPVVARGKVWLAISDGSVHALDAFTGERLWVHEPRGAVTAPSSLALFPGPVLVRDRLYQREGRRLVAIRADSGLTVTSLTLPNGDVTYPAAAGRTIVIGVGTALYAVSPSLDRVVWRTNLNDEGPLTPVVFGGVLFTGTRRGSVLALDAGTGRILWRRGELPASVAGVSADGDMVFASTSNGNLYALDAQSGRLLWRFDTAGSFVSEAAVSGGSVLFGSNDGQLYSVGAEDGRFEWSYETQEAVVVSLAMENDISYFAADSPSGGAGSTRLVSFDAARALAGLRPFGGPVRGRRVEQDTVSTVLVDSAVVAVRDIGRKGGVWTALAWPYRFLSATGNPNALVRGSSSVRAEAAADALAGSAAALGLTSGPVALFVFFAAFAASVLAAAVRPGLSILGGVEESEAVGKESRRGLVWGSVRQALHCGWMLGVAYVLGLAPVPLFVTMRLIAGPADRVPVFMMWAGISSVLLLLVSSTSRILLLRGASSARRGCVLPLSQVKPRGVVLYRVVSLYVLASLAVAVTFMLVDVSGATNNGWLMVPAILVWAACAPALLADCYIAAHGESLPRSYVAAAQAMARRPGAVAAYVGVALAATVLPAVLGAFWGVALALGVALVADPFASAVLAVMAVDICA